MRRESPKQVAHQRDVHHRGFIDHKEIVAALKAALAQEEPESAPQAARRLGYAGSGPFFGPFPALCRAICFKIARRKKTRIRAMRRIIERTLGPNPPPTLRDLAVRVGYKD